MDGFQSFGPWISDEAVAQYAAESAVAAPPEGADIPALRTHYDAFNRRHLAVAQNNYAADVVEAEIGGVRVDLVTPAGVSLAAGSPTLLCLHGGAFMWGRGAGALLEAVPVAATTGMRVIAVEYALAPEQIFPAAVEDVLAVYQACLAQQPARSIGIYGCSAGAVLTSQAVSRMIADNVPRPGAIAMLHGAGLEFVGDAQATEALLRGAEPVPPPAIGSLPYLASTTPGDPLVFAGEHPEVLAQFPPSLLVTGSRDFAAGAVTVMHRRLQAAGVPAELFHFDGMWHAHHMATALPEARETFDAMARFFQAHLA